MFGLFGGFSCVNEMADEIGIERRIFKTALTEVGVNFAHLKGKKKSFILSGKSEMDAIKELVFLSLESASAGLGRLEAKFPNQPDIDRAKASLSRWIESEAQNWERSDDVPSPPMIGLRLIEIQLTLKGRSKTSFGEDLFSLGYVFGMAEMAYFQTGGSLEDQTQALNYILLYFSHLFDEDGGALIQKAIHNQSSTEFDRGKNIGASELGKWLETQGQFKPMGLM